MCICVCVNQVGRVDGEREQPFYKAHINFENNLISQVGGHNIILELIGGE